MFSANPLSLSVPEAEFESWLRDTGYLDLLDDRYSSPKPSPRPPTSSSFPLPLERETPSPLSFFTTLLSILTVNPFAKLNSGDFNVGTSGFLTSLKGSSYSWPGGPSIARMRIQENVKRYARNYAALWLIVFACTLYKMPMALFGVVLSLGMWEVVWMGIQYWDPEENRPGVRFYSVRFAQIATAAVLYTCHLQVAIFCAISISYTVMILHASLRKLSSSSTTLNRGIRQKTGQRLSLLKRLRKM